METEGFGWGCKGRRLGVNFAEMKPLKPFDFEIREEEWNADDADRADERGSDSFDSYGWGVS